MKHVVMITVAASTLSLWLAAPALARDSVNIERINQEISQPLRTGPADASGAMMMPRDALVPARLATK